MQLACFRSFFFPAFLASVLVLCGAFYLEHGLGQAACLLCQGQRILLGSFSLVCLSALILRSAHVRLHLLACLVFAIGGAALAARHVWLQGGAASGLPCAYSAAIEQAATDNWVQYLLSGWTECAPITWSFLDMSAPEWSLLVFLGLGAMVVSRLVSRRSVNPDDAARS